MEKLVVYYAHSMHLYGTPQEQRDMAMLESIGFEVLNPNDKEYKGEIARWKKKYGMENVMSYFDSLIEKCDILAFRAHPDGKIGSGVVYEIKSATKLFNIPIFELPNLVSTRNLSREDTNEYLKLMGER